MAPELNPGVRRVQIFFLQMTYFTVPNNITYMKFTLKLVPSLADVRVLHGDGDGPGTSPRCQEGSEKISND